MTARLPPHLPDLLRPLPDDIRRAERQRWWYWGLALAAHAAALGIVMPNPAEVPPLPLIASLRAISAEEARPAAPPPNPAVTPRSRASTPSRLQQRPETRPSTTETSPPVEAPAVMASTSPTPAGRQDAASVIAARFDADYLHNPKPSYPALSRRLQEEGKVLLSVLVSSQGTARDVTLKASSGYPRLDQAAQDAVARWRFVPARRGDEAIESWVTVPIAFALE